MSLNINQKFPVFRITTVMTENCNLRCKYCYVARNPEIMSEEVILALIKQMEKKINAGYRINIDIFGGEPLLAKERVKFYITQLSELNDLYPSRVTAVIITNGTLVDEDFAKFTEKFRHFIFYNFSMDGCAECHNSARIYPDGKGSYEDVLNGIWVISKVYGYDENHVGGKFVLSPYNIRYLVQTAEECLKKGKHRLSFALQRDNVWDEESIREYEKNITELAEFYIANINSGLWYDIFALPILDYEYRSQAYCASGRTHWGIAPNGDIYPCQRFFNNKSGFKFGDVFNGVGENNKWQLFFKAYSVPNNFTACKSCDLFTNFNCTGQCMAAMHENGNMFKVIPCVCELLKINYRISKYVQSKLKGNPYYEKTLSPSVYGG